MRTITIVVLFGLAASPFARAADGFEKVGGPVPISPTGIPYVLPAGARGAGWTLAAEEARLGMAGSNPAYFASGARVEASLGTTWAHRSGSTPAIDLVDDTVRFDAALGSVRVGRAWLGFGYQNPDHAEYDVEIFRNQATRFVEDLDVWLLGVACKLREAWQAGASVAMLDQEHGVDRRSYQASLGITYRAERALVGAAFKSEPFGEDRKDMLAPSLIQVDARCLLAPAWALGAGFGTGWWNNTKNGALHSPIDVGVGVDWQSSPMLRLLAGAHHVRERVHVEATPDSNVGIVVHRDQGTFLTAGMEVAWRPLFMALAVEDNHVNSDGATTSVSLTARAAY